MTTADAPLALVLGARSNAADPSPPVTLSDYLLQAAAEAGQQISVIEADGRPQVFAPPPFQSNDANSAALQQDADNYLSAEFGSDLPAKFHAHVAQANLLAALNDAANATAPDGNIIVVDSGLQTVTPLEYQNGDLLEAQPADVVTSLREQHLLPDLTGRHVLLVGFGQTAPPQPALDEAQQDNLLNQWEAIVTAGGACVTVNTQPNTAPELPGLPPVAIVTPPPPTTIGTCGTFALQDAGSVGFEDGNATFRNPSQAQATLEQLASKLKENNEPITLIGSTSTEGGDALNYPLSLKRANAVKQILVSMGIAATRITTVGDGSHYPERIPDIGPGGVLIPGAAEQDREVIVQLPPCS